MTPTQRTLKACREQGRITGVVERFNAFVGEFGIRQDLFGFIDIICIDPVDGIIAVQSCGQDFSGHIHKLTEERNEAVFEWLKHAKVELWGWRKIKLNRGGKAERWSPRIADFSIGVNNELEIRERK
jgi:predicted TIM-barrel fold metal-dependent hydrolase